MLAQYWRWIAHFLPSSLEQEGMGQWRVVYSLSAALVLKLTRTSSMSLSEKWRAHQVVNQLLSEARSFGQHVMTETKAEAIRFKQELEQQAHEMRY